MHLAERREGESRSERVWCRCTLRTTGSPFAGKFFAVTAFNNTIYYITADGGCKPFVNFDGYRFGSPAGLGFTADRKDMLVTVAQGEIVGNPTSKGGAIVRVTAEGKIYDTPIVKGLT